MRPERHGPNRLHGLKRLKRVGVDLVLLLERLVLPGQAEMRLNWRRWGHVGLAGDVVEMTKVEAGVLALPEAAFGSGRVQEQSAAFDVNQHDEGSHEDGQDDGAEHDPGKDQVRRGLSVQFRKTDSVLAFSCKDIVE